MSEIEIVKSEYVNGIQCDFYRDPYTDTFYMTIDQLSKALGYAHKNGIEKILSRSAYLKSEGFSTTDSLSVVENGRQVTRKRTLLTEDGIYEIAMLSKTPNAIDFRAKIRDILKKLRVNKIMSQEVMFQLQEIAGDIAQLQNRITALEKAPEITAKPKVNAITESIPYYTASVIAREVGVDNGVIGKFARAIGLKTTPYIQYIPGTYSKTIMYTEEARQIILERFRKLKK